MAQSFIFFGHDKAENLKKAQSFAMDYMKKSSAINEDLLEKHINNGTYPNLFVLQKPEDANEISIDDARKVIEFLSKKPLIKGNSVVMIKSAEFLSKNSANCLLKILEEPPEEAILILVTNKLMSIIPTIRSRCIKIKVDSQKFDIGDFADFHSYVANVFNKKEKIVSDLFLKNAISFVSNGMKNIPEFSKSIENSELDYFVEICFLYAYFHFYKSLKESYAKVVLEIQDLIMASKNTYPDKQSLITAIWCIFNGILYK